MIYLSKKHIQVMTGNQLGNRSSCLITCTLVHSDIMLIFLWLLKPIS